MGGQNPFIGAHQCRDRNRFGRRERKVVKNPAISGVIACSIRPRSIQPLSQGLAGSRMPIFTEAQKGFRANLAGQAQPLRAQSQPMSCHPLPRRQHFVWYKLVSPRYRAELRDGRLLDREHDDHWQFSYLNCPQIVPKSQ